MIKMTQGDETESKREDQRIQKGQAMERLKKNPDFEIFMTEVSSRRDMSHYDFMANGNSKGCGEWLRARLHAFDEVMGIMDEITLKMRIAIHENSEEADY